MQDVEDLLKQIIKQTKDKQAKYFYGYEFSSETGPNFKAMIKYSKEGVTPFLAGAPTKAKLKKELQRYIDGDDVKDIAVQYCKGQIHLEETAIKFHEGLIRDYENQ